MSTLDKAQKARAAALETAVETVTRGAAEGGASSLNMDPEDVLAYAEFILGEGSAAGPDDEPDATSSQPIGEDPGDAGILTAWTEAIRSREAEREAEREAAELERRAERDEALERRGPWHIV